MQKVKNDKLPKISIVIPSYNKVKYISQTLKSVFGQKYPNLEVIIQDGGSTDGTVGIIKDFAKKHSIIWVSKKDNGQLDAINTGFEKATGDIQTFINADDCYQEGSFSMVAETCLKNIGALWFAGQGIVINEKNIEIAKPITLYKNFLLHHSNYYSLLANNYLIQPSVFISRRAFEEHGPFVGTCDFVMEYDMWLKLGKVSMPVIIKKDISRFRIEPNTKTKRMSKSLLLEDWKIVRKYTNNPILLLFHRLNNFGRLTIGRFV